MKSNILPEYPEGACVVLQPFYSEKRNKNILGPQAVTVAPDSERSWVNHEEQNRVTRNYDLVKVSCLGVDRFTRIAWSKHAFANGVDADSIRRRSMLGRIRGYEKTEPVPFKERLRALPLSPDQWKYDRAVGIEIECYGPSLGDKLPLWAHEKPDGSLSERAGIAGIEFAVLLKRQEMEFRLKRMCDLLSGHKVYRECGLHVHLDMRGRTAKEVGIIARRMNAWLFALRELVPVSRRENSYCQFGLSEKDRYHAVNLCSYGRYRTLEIRLHSGTVDYNKIVTWVRLLELIQQMPKAPKPETGTLAALTSLPLPDHERAYWLARHKQLNPALYGGAVVPSTEQE